MSLGMVLALVVLGQGKSPAKIDPDQFPLALHRSMELDDLDREILRQHDAVNLRRSQVAISQRLSQRGVLSRGDLERETADLKYQEAREAEYLSYRALKVYERDVNGRAIPSDEVKAYSLLLDWVRKQGAIAQVDVDYRTSSLKQTHALFAKKAVSRQEMDDAELALNTAEATIALSRSREAQVTMEITARTGAKPYDPVEVRRLKGLYLNARVRYYEISLEGARRRLDIAKERVRKDLIPETDLPIFEKALTDAEAALNGERNAVKTHDGEPPPPPSRKGAPTDSGTVRSRLGGSRKKVSGTVSP